MKANGSSKFKADKNMQLAVLESKQAEEEYSRYVDSADVIIEYYKHQNASNLEKYFVEIEEWLQKPIEPENNKPLLIEASEGVGKKTLLVKWMEYHKNNSKKKFPDIIIPHFSSVGGNNSNYFYAIYKILIKLRENFNIKQKVELLEEKLRKFFLYWLDVCSRRIKNEVFYDGNVIVVIEGVDHFHEMDQRKEAHLKFWLPKILPDRIRFIVTADLHSNANQYLKRIGCDLISIPAEKRVISSVIAKYKEREAFVTDTHKNKISEIISKIAEASQGVANTLFIKSFLSIFNPYPSEIIQKDQLSVEEMMTIFTDLDYNVLERLDNTSQLFNFILTYFEEKIVSKADFIKLMGILSVTQKGLSFDEIQRIIMIDEKQWLKLIAVFKTFFMLYQGLWKNNNEFLKTKIEEKYLTERSFISFLHKEIAKSLEDTPNSIRKLEEQTYNLYCSKEYFVLKQVVSNIENFLLLFNPLNKYDLCRYWQTLELMGYDPVTEYNKAIELFDMHYNPSPENLFKIILQISRFLKEFSDFETNLTPEFRHPHIKNKIIDDTKPVQIVKNSANDDALSMISASKKKKLPALDRNLANNPFLEEGIITNRENELFNLEANKKKTAVNKKINYLESIGLLDELEKLDIIRVNGDVLETHEKSNLETPGGREIFLNYFKMLLAEKSKKIKSQEDAEKIEENYAFDIDKDEMEQEESSRQKTDIELLDVIHKMNKNYDHKMLDEIDLKIEPKRSTKFYYYKRWIWMCFPWVSLSNDLRHQFSSEIARCYSSSTQYMSVNDEKVFTKQALQIVIEAKREKVAIYMKKDLNGERGKSLKGSIEKSKSQILPNLEKSRDSSHIEGLQVQKRMGAGNQNRCSTVANDTNILPQQMNKKESQKKIFFITEDMNSQAAAENKPLTKKKDIKGVTIGGPASNPSAILEKSKYIEDNLRMTAVDKNIDYFQNIKEDKALQSVLSKLKDTMIEITDKELYLLNSKAENLRKVLNELIHKNNEYQKYINDLKLAINGLNNSKMGLDENKYYDKLNSLKVKCLNAEQQMNQEIATKSRMKRIIEICEINKEQNEVWIRGLNYLINNLNKVILWQKQHVDKCQDDTNELLKLFNDYYNTHRDKTEGHSELLQELEKNIKNQRIQNHIVSSLDAKIEMSIMEQAEKIQQNNNSNLRDSELKKKGTYGKNVEKWKSTVTDELSYLEEKYLKLKSVFQPEAGVSMEKAKKFQGFLDKLEKKQNLQNFKFQLIDKSQELEIKKSHLKDKLELVKKASMQKDNVELESDQDLTDKINNLKNEANKAKEHLENAQEFHKKIRNINIGALMTLKNIFKNYSIPTDTSTESILPYLNERGIGKIVNKMENYTEFIKNNLNQEDYKLFLEGRYQAKNIIGNSSSMGQISTTSRVLDGLDDVQKNNSSTIDD